MNTKQLTFQGIKQLTIPQLRKLQDQLVMEIDLLNEKLEETSRQINIQEVERFERKKRIKR